MLLFTFPLYVLCVYMYEGSRVMPVHFYIYSMLFFLISWKWIAFFLYGMPTKQATQVPKQTNPQRSNPCLCKAKPEYSLLLQCHFRSFSLYRRQKDYGGIHNIQEVAPESNMSIGIKSTKKPTTTFNASNWVLDVLTCQCEEHYQQPLRWSKQRKHVSKCYYTVILSAADCDAASETGLKRMRELQHCRLWWFSRGDINVQKRSTVWTDS